ncbi:MAG: hypothetical protein BWK80_63155 [Desulfobacteraceae bacterium IS3]|nr:MAG: hypothetical protein BWK80_63155 [Desulfobacteraceae bacterium IS3]
MKRFSSPIPGWFHQHYVTKFPGKIRNMGCTAAHICYVATGRAEAAIIGNESYRDIAAAWIIVQAAGGKIYRMDGAEFIQTRTDREKESNCWFHLPILMNRFGIV